jgi:hypothetical protein
MAEPVLERAGLEDGVQVKSRMEDLHGTFARYLTGVVNHQGEGQGAGLWPRGASSCEQPFLVKRVSEAVAVTLQG